MFYPLKMCFSESEYAQAAIKLGVSKILFAAVFLLLIALSACTPELNWREVGFEATGSAILMPCKPEASERMVNIEGQTVQMQMRSCKTAGALFALTLIELQDAGAVEKVKKALTEQSRATHQKALSHGRLIVHAAIAGQPQEGRDGPGALANEVVGQFLGSLKLAGAQ